MPLWIKLFQTIFVIVFVPVYWKIVGPLNFLWFSDIALFVSVVALWRESRLLASMMAISVAILECVWVIDFFGHMIKGEKFLGLAHYMFGNEDPTIIKILSGIFHFVLPALSFWMVRRLGYDSRAFKYQTVVCWVVLPVTFWLADKSANINWVWGLGSEPQTTLPPLLYLGLLMLAFPFLVYWPSHKLFAWVALKC